MTWYDAVNSIALVGALGVAAYQLRRAGQDARQRDVDARTSRALDLYRDLVVEGDTAAAFHRLSLELRRRGTQRHGATTWLLLDDSDFDHGGVLDPQIPGSDSPFEDLYRVLWYFERVQISLKHGLVDESVLMETIGFHCWWWGELLRGVTTPKASAALRELRPVALAWAVEAGTLETWAERCQTDFDGGGPRPTGSGSAEV